MNLALRTALLASALMSPLTAQTSALFADSTAFGGSKVFSEGISPLGNPARFDLRRPYCSVKAGTYLSFTSGGQEAKDFTKGLEGLKADDQARIADGFAQLAQSPWALKTRAYGLGSTSDGGHLSYTREETTSLWANPDTLPAHSGSPSNLLLNTTTIDSRRTIVDRVALGMAGAENATSMGATIRIERWTRGMTAYSVNPSAQQLPLMGQDADPLGFRQGTEKTITSTIDAGFTFQITNGIQFGALVNRIVPKRIWDVNERAQTSVGLQIDIGTTAKLVLETDLNSAERMPYPVKQRTSAVSLVVDANPSLSFTIGAERRTIGGVAVTRGGATIRLHTASITLGAGIQLGQDRPLVGGALFLQ